MKSLTINIKDMGCSGCVSAVEEALNNLNGVSKATAALDSGTATIEFTGEALSEEELKKAVSNAGYTVTDIK